MHANQLYQNDIASDAGNVVEFKPRAANIARSWLETVDARCWLSITALRAGRVLCGESGYADTGTPFYRRRRRYVTDGSVVTVGALKKLAERHGCNERTLRRGIEQFEGPRLDC